MKISFCRKIYRNLINWRKRFFDENQLDFSFFMRYTIHEKTLSLFVLVQNEL